ncbi:MAG: phage virion morphogenesis protein [Altererythrobacter sp.]|nr:phage virion morphogenesis protein [Altererythrobacter sp.]OJU60945.1 MAG: hypothetical protein BGO08_12530 [Altererythrobacter sp. 66-12]
MFGVQFNAGRSRQAIREAIAQLDDMTPVFDDIAEYMLDATRQRFIKGVAPDGTPWAPKKQSTLDRYKRLGYGSLTRPLIGPGKALSTQIQRLVSKDGVVIGSSLIYSEVQQSGAVKGAFGADRRGRPIPWGSIPARTWLGISRDDETAIVRMTEAYVASTLDAP